jgi:signal recognition particle subunit SRP54
MFSLLADKLDDTFRKLRGMGKISEKNISDALRDIRLSLLEADVEFGVAREFITRVKDRALGQEVLKSVKPGEQIVKIFHDEITALLGGDAAPLDLTDPARIMVVGLNGAGKTTTSAKLALRLKNEGRRPVLIACDLIRPAAIDQLATLAQQIDVPVYCPEAGERDVIKVARAGLAWAKDQNATVTIIDTAGRQEVDEALIDELKQLHSFVDPRETLLVVDSATGQQAVQVAQTFDQAVSVTGIVLTKLDGDARGGAALSMRSVTGKPIKFAGEGEKLDQFGPFYPDRMADRILGMGDIVGLVEKAAANIDEKKATKSVNRFMSGQFDFNDFLDQMKMIQNLGPLEGLLGLLPGFNKIKKQLPADAFDPKKMKHVEAMILSMTPEERSNPDVMNMSRRRRIAKGSGLPIEKVNQNIKRFMEMRKMMSGKGPMGALMKQMRGGQGGKKGKGTPQLPANMKLPDLSSMSGLGGLGGLGGLFRKK